ncbi:MAG: FAD/FMN-containing dehydrogenase [Candidatus Paceibacteria bacterium]|jgi:FAD/FMN-containing dehydrogenase
MDLEKELSSIIEGEVAVDDATLEINSEDTSILKICPSCVVSPKHKEDLSKLIHFVHQHRGEMSLTAWSAGTDMSDGPLTSSIVVDFLRYFNHVHDVSQEQATAEPGVFYRDFEPLTLFQNAILPCYTASRELNTLGGMVANNSAGEKSLTFGKTERYVKALKVVLQDGNEYVFKKINRAELEAKKFQLDYEGEIYRRVESLINENIETIESERSTVSKNSPGYEVWDIWDKENDTFDMTQLFVGSQGTLGLISEITFSLVEPQNESRMLVLFLRPRHMKQLGSIVNTVLKESPESFESYDDKTFNVMLRVFPKLFGRLGGNPFKIVKDFWPEIKTVLTGGIPKLVLMAEFTGTDESEVIARRNKAEEAIKELYDIDTHVTSTKEEGNKFWVVRRESFELLRENVRHRHTAPFIDDISVRPEHLPEFLPKLYAILDEYNLIYTMAGHVGDGNFHIIPLMDFKRPDFVKIVTELSDKVYTLVGEYKGSITGEHNDGIIRTPYLHKMFSASMLSVFSEIKEIFDPHRIFNPHKKVDADMELLKNSIKSQS